MTTLEKKELKLYQSFVNESNYERVVQTAAEVFENPVFVFDASFKMITSSKKICDVKTDLVKVGNRYVLPVAKIGELSMIDDLARADNSDEIIRTKFKSTGCSLVFRRVSDSLYTMGYICIYGENREINKEDEELLNIAANIAIRELEMKNYANKVDCILYRKIIDGVLTNREEIELLLGNLNVDINMRYRMLLLSFDSQQYLLEYLTSKYVNSIFFLHNNKVLAIVDADKFNVVNLFEQIDENFKRYNCKVAVSDAFDSLLDLKESYEQAVKCYEIGKKCDKEGRIYFYENYKTLLLFERLDRELLCKTIDVRLKKVIEYDKTNNTEYLNDLKMYFSNCRNITRTAEAVFIHKNSMYYRLEKISERFGIDLKSEEDCFSIELSLKIYSFLSINY